MSSTAAAMVIMPGIKVISSRHSHEEGRVRRGHFQGVTLLRLEFRRLDCHAVSEVDHAVGSGRLALGAEVGVDIKARRSRIMVLFVRTRRGKYTGWSTWMSVVDMEFAISCRSPRQRGG